MRCFTFELFRNELLGIALFGKKSRVRIIDVQTMREPFYINIRIQIWNGRGHTHTHTHIDPQTHTHTHTHFVKLKTQQRGNVIP